MADASGQADIRGIDINKLAMGFAEEENVFKKFCTVSKAAARELRWYQKTAGFLDSTDTSGITASQIANTAERALPVVVEQSWTRITSHIRKYFVQSPLISEEDIKGADIQILATNVRDLVRAVQRQVDTRIYNVITEDQSPSTINTAAAVGTGWDDATNGDPIEDILVGQKNIRDNSYEPKNGIIAMDPLAHQQLMVFLISTKGASIPAFSSEKVASGVLMELLGMNIVVSTNVVTDSVAMWVPTRTCTWKTFMNLSSVVITDPGIGRTIRVWEEGEALLTDPKSVHLITDTTT